MNKIYDELSRLIIKSENIALYVGLLFSRQQQLYLLSEQTISLLTNTWRSLIPCIKARARYSIQTTHYFDPIPFARGFNKLKDFAFCSEENRMAFFSSSCSS